MVWVIVPWVNVSRFWPETFNFLYKELYIIASYRIVASNPVYNEEDLRDDSDEEHLFRNSTFHKGAITVVLRTIHIAIVINSCQ